MDNFCKCILTENSLFSAKEPNPFLSGMCGHLSGFTQVDTCFVMYSPKKKKMKSCRGKILSPRRAVGGFLKNKKHEANWGTLSIDI